MAVFLRDVAGEPLSSFSQGSSQWASGGTNGGSPSFGQPNTLFGANITSRGVTTPTSTSITRPGSTSGLGFTDPLKSKPGAHGSPMNPVAPSTETGSSGTPTAANIKGDANPAGMAGPRRVPRSCPRTTRRRTTRSRSHPAPIPCSRARQPGRRSSWGPRCLAGTARCGWAPPRREQVRKCLAECR